MDTTAGSGDSVHAFIARARDRLRDAGLAAEDASLDARLLAQHVLGWDAVRLLTGGSEPAPEGFASAFRTMVERRVRREPVAYITGSKEFWGLSFEVTADVLVPRPETEFLVETLLKKLPDAGGPRIVDVCTGSGCVAIAIAHERPTCRIVATDISSAAMAVAARNAARHGLDGRLQLLRGDLLAGVQGPFDAIVANPPYVPLADRATLQPEVQRFEPSLALFSGPCGLDAIRRLVAEAAPRLKPGGWLLFEFGLGQDRAVAELISATPTLTMEPPVLDLQRIPRVAVARRRVDAADNVA